MAWWRGLTGAGRAERWLERISDFDELRYNLIAARNPNASEAEILALWTEQTYRDSMEPTALARWCDMIRARG